MKNPALWFFCVVLVTMSGCVQKSNVSSDAIVLGVQRGALTTPRRTYAIRNDGSGVLDVKLPSQLGQNARWSPNGLWIADVAFRGELADYSQADIYIMRSDGTQRTRITQHSGGSSSVVWSPDGTQIAYYAYDKGQGEGIYVLNVVEILEGKSLTTEPIFLTHGYEPDWSPDGQKIVCEDYDTQNMRASKILVVSVPGGALLRELVPEMDCTFPHWHPDGTQIVLNCEGQIYTVLSDGSASTQLTVQDDDHNWNPQWSPDGSKITFISERDGLGVCIGGIACDSGGVYSNALYMMNADGSDITRLSLRDDESVQWYIWVP